MQTRYGWFGKHCSYFDQETGDGYDGSILANFRNYKDIYLC